MEDGTTSGARDGLKMGLDKREGISMRQDLKMLLWLIVGPDVEPEMSLR